MFALDLGLVTTLLLEGGEVTKLEAEDDIELMDKVADVTESSLLDKVFTVDKDKVNEVFAEDKDKVDEVFIEDKDNVCGWDDDDEDVSPLSLSPVSVTCKNKLLEAV